MKKLFYIFIISSLMFGLSGCSSSQQMDKIEIDFSEAEQAEQNKKYNKPDTHSFEYKLDKPISDMEVDVDLTQLSSTMVFSEVYNMFLNPSDYEGKVIKMSGPFVVYYANPNSAVKHYFAVSIADATACCQQGMEFVWIGKHTYPNDYPEENENITVTGIFQMYEDQGYSYPRIVCETIERTSV